MNIVHGTFTIERTFKASPARLFDAWADPEIKAQWFHGPPDRWKLLRRELDFRVGGVEVLHGAFANGHETFFMARYHSIVPCRRIVYAYDVNVRGRHHSVSLATVELAETSTGGTKMTFVEQAAFLDGEDGTKSRETGTAAHLDVLARTLDDPRVIVSARVLDAPRDRVWAALRDPRALAEWWGPKGVTNTFREFDLRPGGAWRFTMHGADGKDYEMVHEFIEVSAPSRLVFRHVQAGHDFTMTMTLSEAGARTHFGFRMVFDDAAEAERVRAFVTPANEENFDRLAAHLSHE
jgi:uncharacterized protein YndB with AHSA1/START domain